MVGSGGGGGGDGVVVTEEGRSEKERDRIRCGSVLSSIIELHVAALHIYKYCNFIFNIFKVFLQNILELI